METQSSSAAAGSLAAGTDVLFFVHIQKTAGGTLRRFIRDHLPPGAVYPEGGHDAEPLACYWEVERLRAIAPERRGDIRAYIGHFPFAASLLVEPSPITITVLRDPVERTISYLKMRSNDPERAGLSLEQIYDHTFDFPSFIHNHQAKVFAMTTDDKLETFMDVLEVDDERLAIAKENLRTIDILGLQEEAPKLLDVVASRFGWTVDAVENRHVSEGSWEIPDSLRDRIAEDNAVDIEFYEFGRALYEERAHS